LIVDAEEDTRTWGSEGMEDRGKDGTCDFRFEYSVVKVGVEMETTRKRVAAVICDAGCTNVSAQARSIAVKAQVRLRTALESLIFVRCDVKGKGCEP
jgi:hypothetical protein